MTTSTRKPISLKKAEEKVIISLKKKDILDPPTVRVGLALDVSGSMHGNYSSGAVADVVTRILALAKTFDDDGSMDVWVFDTGVKKITDATEANYETFVHNEIVRKGYVGGGTEYSPCLNSMVDFYYGENAPEKSGSFFGKMFGKKTEAAPSNTQTPSLAVFITDGETGHSDMSRCRALFERASSKPIYWLLVGVGHSDFEFLSEAADAYPNVGYLQFSDLDMPDETLYDGIITQEFISWVTKK